MRYGLNAAVIASAYRLARGAIAQTANGRIGNFPLGSPLQNSSHIEMLLP
jgi:hypothetical protein